MFVVVAQVVMEVKCAQFQHVMVFFQIQRVCVQDVELVLLQTRVPIAQQDGEVPVVNIQCVMENWQVIQLFVLQEVTAQLLIIVNVQLDTVDHNVPLGLVEPLIPLIQLCVRLEDRVSLQINAHATLDSMGIFVKTQIPFNSNVLEFLAQILQFVLQEETVLHLTHVHVSIPLLEINVNS